jgi:hypothetical protein
LTDVGLQDKQTRSKTPSNKGLTALWVGGLVFMASHMGKPNPNAISGSLVLLAGALAVKARIKRQAGGAIGWLIAEIIAALWITLYILFCFKNDNWHAHPLYYLIAPIWVVITYGFVWMKNKSKVGEKQIA